MSTEQLAAPALTATESDRLAWEDAERDRQEVTVEELAKSTDENTLRVYQIP